ncbi:hypothetical protein [Ectopseudomonas mendocina]|uniref:Uncharacterized protein n=1 Tax=Ectopseudomonas mendocina TaxID=300 RepID=A0A2R3QHP1_ECTME|nr:hypothetical protein [Pseudomonas mendocina]AVO51242.1 hypothetical protein C7A17_00140 [Pseudomonas mendocina]
MSTHRTYPLRRLSPEAGGKLEHDHQRTTSKLAALQREHAELQNQIRTQYGTEALWQLREATRNALLLADIKQEAAA